MKPQYCVAILLYCAGIFWISGQPLDNRPEVIDLPGFDKSAHMVIFAGLAGLVAVGLRRSREQVRPAVLFWAPFLFCALYGLSDESHQLFVRNRFFDPWDLVADVAGAGLAGLVLCLWWWRIPRGDLLRWDVPPAQSP